jgi:sterol desaturase/sphingolipid hydroxylase (fatty acid hydroxylase superfamily)
MGATAVLSSHLLELANVRPFLTLRLGHSSAPPGALSIVGGTAFVLLISDFLYYWFHRLQHTRLLWRFHAVHHAIEDLNAANYAHWTEEAWRLPFMTLPVALLVPSGMPVWSVAAAIATLQSQYIHSPTRLHLGPMWRLIYDNRFHRIHHSLEPRHFDKNFGVLTPLWDWMFGTLYVPAKDEWPETGLLDEPEIDGLSDYLWRPFMMSGKAR